MPTPRLGAPELTAGQATPETTVNEIARYFDTFAGAHFKDRDLATPPGSPAQGDCYLVAASPTGAWSGQAGKIAFYNNTAWSFVTPKEGFHFWVDDENVEIIYDGSAWSTTGGTPYTDENARDAIGTALTAGDGLTKTVNDAGDTITLDWDGGAISVGTPVDGDVLTWDGTNSQWVSAPFGGAGGGGTVPDGGTTGQVLTKDSAVDQDVSWQDAAGFAFPFVQEGRANTSSNGTSFTFTFPQALAASGNTAFLIVATDGSQTITTPAGWTVEIDQVGPTYARLMVLSKATAGETSATFTTVSTTNFAAMLFELEGSRALDQSSLGSTTNASIVAMPSLTPTAGSMVFSMAVEVATSTSGSSTLAAPAISPLWNTVSIVGSSQQQRLLFGHICVMAATGGTLKPPPINNQGQSLFASGGIAYATFSIL